MNVVRRPAHGRDGDCRPVSCCRCTVTRRIYRPTRARRAVGMRPEAFADAAYEASNRRPPPVEARISLAQSMGSEVIAHFDPAGGSVQTEDVLTFTASRTTSPGRDQLASAHQLIGDSTRPTKAAAGSAMTVSLDLERIHFFDPENRARHLDLGHVPQHSELYNFERRSPTGDPRRRPAVLRKVSGMQKPSLAERGGLELAVDDVADATTRLLQSLVTSAPR